MGWGVCGEVGALFCPSFTRFAIPAAWRRSTLAYVAMYGIRMDTLYDKQLKLAQELLQLTPSQQGWVEAVIAQFRLPHRFANNPQSDLITPAVRRCRKTASSLPLSGS